MFSMSVVFSHHTVTYAYDIDCYIYLHASTAAADHIHVRVALLAPIDCAAWVKVAVCIRVERHHGMDSVTN